MAVSKTTQEEQWNNWTVVFGVKLTEETQWKRIFTKHATKTDGNYCLEGDVTYNGMQGWEENIGTM